MFGLATWRHDTRHPHHLLCGADAANHYASRWAIIDHAAAAPAAALPSVADAGRLSIRGVPQPTLAMTLKNSLVTGKFL